MSELNHHDTDPNCIFITTQAHWGELSDYFMDWLWMTKPLLTPTAAMNA